MHDVVLLINKMLSKEDKEIKVLRVDAKRIMTEFPERDWSLASVKCLLHQIDMAGSADRKSGSGQRNTACSGTKVEVAEVLKVYFAEMSHHCLKYMWLSSGKIIFNLVKFYSWYCKILGGSLFSGHSVYHEQCIVISQYANKYALQVLQTKTTAYTCKN